MTAVQTASQVLFASIAGIAVLSTDKTGAQTEFKVARLDSKLGTMKNGDKSEYLVLQRADDEAVIVSIHPNVAKKLFATGEDGTFKVKPVTAAEVLEAEEQAAAQAALDAANGVTVVEDDKTVTEDAKEVKVSKKDQAVAIYLEVVNSEADEKKHRSLVIARFKSELGMSAPGASTYYQNCKGTQKVKWTV